MRDAMVYMRNVQWEVVVPLGLKWEFIEAFGEAFRTTDAMEGTTQVRQVDGYSDHPSGWHIKVTVHEFEERRLLQFCKDFFSSREVSFREPNVPPHPIAAEFLKLQNRALSITLKCGKEQKGVVVGVGDDSVTLYDTNIRGTVPIKFDDIQTGTEEAVTAQQGT